MNGILKGNCTSKLNFHSLSNKLQLHSWGIAVNIVLMNKFKLTIENILIDIRREKAKKYFKTSWIHDFFQKISNNIMTYSNSSGNNRITV